MNVTVNKSVARGKVSAPPSKSMAHRLLIAAAMSRGKSIVRNVSFSEDIKATLSCLEALGVDTSVEQDTVVLRSNGFSLRDGTLFCNESGSTLRFFVPIALTLGERVTFTGSERLLSRPLDEYERLCRERGFGFEKNENSLSVCGSLEGGRYTLSGNVSSQYITGLIFGLAALGEESVIEITPPVSSRAYIDLTLSALRTFGAEIFWQNENTVCIKNSNLTPRDVAVEGDCSNAAFLEALNIFGGEVSVEGISDDTLQGDRVYKEMLDSLACSCPTLDLDACPDLAPVLFTVAAYKSGATFTGTKRLALKESDRASVMACELSKFGADITVNEDSVIIKKTELHTPKEVICGHNDHRVVMSLALLCSVYGGRISGAEAVKKSFPDFFEVIEGLGIDIIRE